MTFTKLFVCVLLADLVDLGSAGSNVQVTCPNGAEVDAVFGAYCFIASKQKTNFAEAYMFCEAYGCTLAVPIDSAMKIAFRFFATANSVSPNDVFLGCSDVLLEDSWMCYGTTRTFTWAWGQPSGGTNDNCLTATDFNSWEMADTSCGGTKKFICDCPPTGTI